MSSTDLFTNDPYTFLMQKDAKDQHFWNSVLRHIPYVLYKTNGRTLSHIANGLARAGVNDKGTWDSILHRYYQIRDVSSYMLTCDCI